MRGTIKAGSAAASGNMSGVAAASFCGEDESDNQAGQNKPCTQSLEIFSHMKPSGLKLQLGLQQQDDQDIHPFTLLIRCSRFHIRRFSRW